MRGFQRVTDLRMGVPFIQSGFNRDDAEIIRRWYERRIQREQQRLAQLEQLTGELRPD